MRVCLCVGRWAGGRRGCADAVRGQDGMAPERLLGVCLLGTCCLPAPAARVSAGAAAARARPRSCHLFRTSITPSCAANLACRAASHSMAKPRQSASSSRPRSEAWAVHSSMVWWKARLYTCGAGRDRGKFTIWTCFRNSRVLCGARGGRWPLRHSSSSESGNGTPPSCHGHARPAG